MVFKKDPRKRRSDRLMFMVPLRVQGLTENGEPFECGGQAVTVNRYGAHIRLDRPVAVAHKIHLTNLENNARGEFRVVDVLESPSQGETDFGVEALGDPSAFWGIDFPAPRAKPGDSRGLLECQRCRTATLHPLTFDEIEALESGDMVQKDCSTCNEKTSWKFAMRSPRTLPAWVGESEPSSTLSCNGKQELEQTVFVQRPVSIRTADDETETVQTENLSKDEIRCTSEKNYELNQVVTLEWENSGTGQRLQVQGRIRRRQTIAGSRRVVYSIRYEAAPVVMPPTPLKSSNGLYAVLAALVVAASALLAFNVESIAAGLAVAYSARAHRVAWLATALILVCLAVKIWKAILKREPETRPHFKKRHRIASAVLAVVFLGSLAVGTVGGAKKGIQHAQAEKLLHDYALARLFEANIDAAENRVMVGPSDYNDACATLELLAAQWQQHLDAVTDDAGALYRIELWRSRRLRESMKALGEIMTLDRRKLLLVEEQIALKAQAATVEPDKRLAFWQSRFPPLRRNILELDQQKSRVVDSLTASN